MLEVFKKPHPFIFNAYSVVIPSIITLIIIVLLAPFHFQELKMGHRLLSALIISGLVALSIMITVKSLKKLFPELMAENKWTIGKEFLLILFVVFIIILFVFMALLILFSSDEPVSRLFVKTAIITFAISILPILISILFEQYRYQNMQLKKAAALTVALKKRHNLLIGHNISKENSERPILIKSENNDIELQLKPQDLIYIKSDGNYVEVYFNNLRETQKKVIRNRLKAIESVLPSDLFFRCHNSFIINGHYIIKVEGNARNLSLHLKGASEYIPVSRAKAKTITTFLENLQ